MSVFASDRNLLVGVLGLQMGLITESALLMAVQSWVFRKSLSLEDILLEQKALSDESCRFLKSLAEQHLKLHGDNAAASLATLSSMRPVWKKLEAIGDEELDLTMTRIVELQNDDGGAGHPDAVSESGFSLPAHERFRVLRAHARGGLGVVSIAEDRELNREVAMKEIQPEYVRDNSSRTRFMVEAEITGRLEHPGIVPVYSMGTTSSGSPFYVMRFIHGDSLKDGIVAFHEKARISTPDERRLMLKKLVRRLIDVCNAIEYAHSRGVLHRDLKPGNIMLGKYGETLVVDWGLARTGAKPASEHTPDDATFVPLSSDVSSETRMGSVVGTLAYMSPEQAEGRLDVLGPPADVYSLGATLYCILTGRQPVPRQAQEEMIRIVREGLIEPPRKINPEIPLALDAICRKAMAKEIDNRYASATQLASDLELWLADEPVTAFHEPLSDRLTRFARRHRTAAISTAGVLVTAALALGISNAVVRQKNTTLTAANETIREQNSELETAGVDLKKQKDSALENLSEARGLAVLLLDMAEERLSSSGFGAQDASKMRVDATEAAFKTFRDLHQSNPEDQSTLYEYARTSRTSGNLKRSMGDFPGAMERYQLALDLMNRIPPEQRTLNMRLFLSEVHREIGTLKKGDGKLSQSITFLETAFRLATVELESDPTSLDVARVLAAAELELSGYYMEMMDLEKSLALNMSGTSNIETVLKDNGGKKQDQIVHLLLVAKRVLLLTELSRFEELAGISEASIRIARESQQKSPTDINILLGYSRILTWSAEGTVRSPGVSDTAVEKSLADVDEVIKTIRTAIQKSGQSGGAISAWSDALRVRGFILTRQNKLMESEATLGEALKYSKALLAAVDWAEFHELTAKIIHLQSKNKTAAGDGPAAEKLLEEANAEIRRAIELAPESRWTKQVESRFK